MNLRSRILPPLALLLFCLCCFNTNTAAAASPDHWVGTWATAPMAQANREEKFGAADTTYREIVHVSIGGPTVRVILTNEFGLDSLTIGAANVALSATGSDINPAASSPLTFNGRPSIVIPPGALVVSDPVNLKLQPTSNVAVSIFIPAQAIRQISAHGFADQTNYTAPGNVVSAKSLDTPTEIYSWPFLKGIDVKADGKAAAIVAFGDSITDGAYATRDANTRWPDVLATRLQANKKTAKFGVLNEGIGGNRILHDGTGPSALARFDRDVLAQAGVKYLIILESINDIGHAQDPHRPYDVVSADDLIAGLSQLATRAHTHGIKVFGATLTPYVGAGYSSPAGETIREAVNQWIRTTNQLDGVIDFDKTTRDPANPNVYLPADEHGDHLHPNDAGYKVMGDSIDLKIFKNK
ncbi:MULTISPECIES: SGNH/GDSL hydrolase family protein [Acidobacteriaceae]|uniref:SGNH/GDSL hydrolase family protein n=1 Tax=Acidobacteriaceae TaxID=204434 RepID=UPI00131CF53B|nr:MULTISPECIES: SGNH/GDSL hydrolase family protein [Acidobacteriaceae]MDW5266400.1 SGNH/GDSL hydrolase family protein [Edaphobacter sp.]